MRSTVKAAPTLLHSSTSADGLLTLTLSSSNPSDTVGVDNTYIWTATNNSGTTLSCVILGSHWGDWCGAVGGRCFPTGPTLISVGSGCGGQNTSEFVVETAHIGVVLALHRHDAPTRLEHQRIGHAASGHGWPAELHGVLGLHRRRRSEARPNARDHE
jgi:hypothetical protein